MIWMVSSTMVCECLTVLVLGGITSRDEVERFPYRSILILGHVGQIVG